MNVVLNQKILDQDLDTRNKYTVENMIFLKLIWKWVLSRFQSRPKEIGTTAYRVQHGFPSHLKWGGGVQKVHTHIFMFMYIYIYIYIYKYRHIYVGIRREDIFANATRVESNAIGGMHLFDQQLFKLSHCDPSTFR